MSSKSEAYILLNLNVEGVLGHRLFFWGTSLPPHPNLLLGILGVGEGMGWAEVRGDMECLSWEMHLVFGRNKIT
jgi:hypothetical protein